MRILYICEEYPPGASGGIGTMVQTLGRELVRQGHEVFVVGLYLPGYGQKDYEEDQGVKVWRLRYKNDIGLLKNNFSAKEKLLWKFVKGTGILHLDTIMSTRRLFRFVSELVKKHSIDIIEIQDWNTIFQNAFTSIKLPDFGIPVTVKFNGSHSYFAVETKQPVKKYVYRSENMLMQRADSLSSVSRYTAERTAELFRIEKHVEILYNSINIPSITEKIDNKNVVVFTGSLIYKKGIFSLLKAWNFVIKKRPEAKLKIFGKGAVQQLKLILSAEALPTVFFEGHVQRQQLFNELAGASMAVFPSYSECFAFAPLEAMAVGCAVINTSRSSGRELIRHGDTGLLIDPDEPEAIADAILRLLENEELRNSIAHAGQQLILNSFNIGSSAREHATYYERVIKDFRSNHRS